MQPALGQHWAVKGARQIENMEIGVISNLDGGFKVPLRYREMGSVLVISSMGYRTKKLSIYDMSLYIGNTIRLEPALFELPEAIVKSKKRKKLSAEEIIQYAIDAIPENYPTDPYAQVGYYRDYQFDNGQYVNLNEAILEVFDQGFRAIDSATTKVLLYDYNENTEFKRDTSARKPYDYNMKNGAKIINTGYLDSYGGNEFTILGVHNAIRNYKINSYSFIHRFDTDLLKEHSFVLEKDTYVDNEVLYTIRFTKKLLSHSAYGKLFISKSDFSIYKMEYSVYDDSKESSTKLPDKNVSKNQLIFEVNTSYRNKEGKMYLSFISFHNNFTLWSPPKLRLKYVEFKFDKKPVNQLGAGVYDSLFKKERLVNLTFSDNLDINTASNLKNYKAQFNGEELKFDSLKVSGNKVTLYPRAKRAIQVLMLNEMETLSKKNALNEKNVQFKIKNLKDLNHNVISEWTSKEYNQFREFFVQQINSFSPVRVSFMKKDRPIFKDQPTVKPNNFDEYWMNTPLKKSQ